MSFGTPLSALNTNENEMSSSPQNGPVPANKGTPPKQPITLDPATLNNAKQGGGTSYANVKMMNTNNLSELQDKLCSNNTTNIQAPFTIQGFNDRYKSENHSEISC